MKGALTALEGMVIGAVDPIVITADTPINPDQWEDGLAWHIKRSTDTSIRPSESSAQNAGDISTSGKNAKDAETSES